MDVVLNTERAETRCSGQILGEANWLAAPSEPALDPDQQPDPFPPRPKTDTARRILIVDDDKSVLDTMAELLELAGFQPIKASDASEAIMILRQDATIDALVTDLTMPGADGITLIRQAREIKPSLPAILLTGYAEQVTSVATIAGGNFHVLRKPVESERLIQQLELLMTNAAEQ